MTKTVRFSQGYWGILLGSGLLSQSIIFERSWRRGEVPEDWRKASVIPVFKKGKKADPENYRLVSLTSIPGKVMEQLILEVINKQVEDSPRGNHA